MATWTVETEPGTRNIIYTDGKNGSGIRLKLGGADLSWHDAANISATLTMDQAGMAPLTLGRYTITPSTLKADFDGVITAQINITIDPATGASQPYLQLTNGANKGTLQLNVQFVGQATVRTDPAEIKNVPRPTPVVATVDALETLRGAPLPPGIPLIWTTDSNVYVNVQPGRAATPQTDGIGTQFSMTTTSITEGELLRSGPGTVTCALYLGYMNQGTMTVGSASTSINPGLLAPIYEPALISGADLIDDKLYAEVGDAGYPFRVPIGQNGRAQDAITLYAYAASDPRRGTKYPLKQYTVTTGDLGRFATLRVPRNAYPLYVPGNWCIAYTYSSGASTGQSDSLPLTVDVSTTTPYAHPSESLLAPTSANTLYNKALHDIDTDLSFYINFRGAFALEAGDQIQPMLHLVGYTNANKDRLYNVVGPAYEITSNDILNNRKSYPFPDPTARRSTITHEQLNFIDGSRGILYFIYTSKRTGVAFLSPGLTYLVDVVPPYSA